MVPKNRHDDPIDSLVDFPVDAKPDKPDIREPKERLR